MGRVFLEPATAPRPYICKSCGVVLGERCGLSSRAFHGRGGRAYLFNFASNLIFGAIEDRALLTGIHTVADVKCAGCARVVGWAYLWAASAGQRYKHGKVVLERAQLDRATKGDGDSVSGVDDGASSGAD